MSSETQENLDANLPVEEQDRITRRATALHEFEKAAMLAYKIPTPANLSACDHANTWAKHCGVTHKERWNVLSDVRERVLHGR